MEPPRSVQNGAASVAALIVSATPLAAQDISIISDKAPPAAG
jgi:hypothetical protein